jgi:ribonuclease HI
MESQGPEPQSSPGHTILSSLMTPPVSRGGAGVLFLTLDGEQFKYMVHLDFKATNNMVEYEALIFGLGTALSLGFRQLLVKGDSQLVFKQVEGKCCYNNPHWLPTCSMPRSWKRTLRSLTYTTSLV